MFQTGEKHELFCGGVRHGAHGPHAPSSLLPHGHRKGTWQDPATQEPNRTTLLTGEVLKIRFPIFTMDLLASISNSNIVRYMMNDILFLANYGLHLLKRLITMLSTNLSDI